MAKVDLDKLICSYLKRSDDFYHPKFSIHDLLSDQGLEYKDGRIVEILPATEGEIPPTPKFRKGDWIIDKEDHEVFMVKLPEKENSDSEELTGFENAVREFHQAELNRPKGHVATTHNYKVWAKELLSAARKQIASEIDPQSLVANRVLTSLPESSFMAYRYGIEDVLTKIKEGCV